MLRAFVVVWLMCCGGLVQSAAAQREPTLHVRAGTRIELHARSRANLLSIEGRLVDDLDQPLAGRSVTLTLMAADGEEPWEEPPTRTLRTDAAGSFSQQLTSGTGRYTLQARFGGDALHEPAETIRTFEVRRASVQLQLSTPAGHVVSLDEPSAELEVRAFSDAGVAGLLLTLKDEAGRTLANGGTDAQGVWRVALPTAELGEPGRGEWTVTSLPDAEHAAGSGVLTVLRYRATQLELDAHFDAERQQIRTRGSLATRAAPVAGAAVGLFVDGQHAQTVVTDAAGRFEHALPFEPRFEPVTRYVAARFDSARSGLGSSLSTEQALHVPARPGPSLAWILVPSLASLALFWLVLSRSGSWSRPSLQPMNAAGVQLGTAHRRAPSLDGLDGVIEDADTAARLDRASLRVTRHDGVPISVPVQRGGQFAVAKLDAGTYRIEARAPGYAVEATEVRVPHAGEGRGLRVRLRSLRALALEAHRPILRRVFPSRERQQTATAREALQQAPPSWPRGELEHLTELVEHTAYGAEEPTAEQVRAIETTTRELDRS